MADLKAPAFDPQKFAKWWMMLGNDARFPALGLDVGHLVVGHSDEGYCFGIKDGIKRSGRNGKILVWQRIIAGFDPSRPSQSLSLQNNKLEEDLRRVPIDSMSRHVAKISVCFQGLPKIAGGSTRHGRDMKREKSPPFGAR
jgi:hypothetical protein